MLRCLVAIVLIGCHHTAPPSSTAARCPGPYPITPGTCTTAAPTGCRGLCGVVVKANGCAPVPHASVVVDNLVVGTDTSGQFDIGPLPPGHHQLRVMAEQDVGLFELDSTGGPQPLPAPLELQLADRSCECGGACPT